MNKEVKNKKTFYRYKKVLRHEKHNLKDWSQTLDKIYSEEGEEKPTDKSHRNYKFVI